MNKEGLINFIKTMIGAPCFELSTEVENWVEELADDVLIHNLNLEDQIDKVSFVNDGKFLYFKEL